MSEPIQPLEVIRELKPALKKGLQLRCPNCGEGRLLHSYLKVNERCSVCQQPFHHQRADDGPAYLTLLVIGHLAGFALHIIWTAWRPEPIVMFAIVATMSVAGALLMLPRMKGMIVAYQWAKRMHGF